MTGTVFHLDVLGGLLPGVLHGRERLLATVPGDESLGRLIDDHRKGEAPAPNGRLDPLYVMELRIFRPVLQLGQGQVVELELGGRGWGLLRGALAPPVSYLRLRHHVIAAKPLGSLNSAILIHALEMFNFRSFTG